MIADLGNLSLYLAFACSLLVALIPILDRAKLVINTPCMRLLWVLNFSFIATSLLALIYCYVISDFSVLNVLYNSHTDKPLIYKISGAWGNHEGSMLLWISAMTFFSMIFALFGDNTPINRLTLVIQGLLTSCILAYTIMLSNPFTRIFPAPKNGLGLNPILQDIGLAFHPPILYLGYIGFSICYSLSIAGLLLDKIDQKWARVMRPWCMLSWIFLTMGIALGSWWAYRELGWGGYWFWDPVENASLMPFLTATALLHTLIVYEKISYMKNWAILLSLSTFMLSLLGTFLVRSGIVTSVHSFAHDPERGMFILGFVACVTIISFVIYAFKVQFSANSPPGLLSKITFFYLGNLLLATATFTVVFGTFYPILLEMITGQKISVGPPYFNKIFGPIAIALAIVCASGVSLSWLGKDHQVKNFFTKNIILSIIAKVLALIILILCGMTDVFALAGVFGGILLIVSMLKLLWDRKISINQLLASGFFSMFLAHIGFGILMIAISLNFSLADETAKFMKKGQGFSFQGYDLTLESVEYSKHSNYISQVAKLSIYRNGDLKAMLDPEVRFFAVEQQQTIEASILRCFFYDLYATIDGIYTEDEGITLRLFYRPMMGWIWFSAFLLALAGVCRLLIFVSI